MIKVTIVYDNTSLYDGLRADWGFACVIDTGGKRILFDTGGDGHLLVSNMKGLGIEPNSVHEIFLSHIHFDHIGGLAEMLFLNPEVRVFAPASLRGIKHAGKVTYIGKPERIGTNCFTTGLLNKMEQSLIIQTRTRGILFVGCAHPGMDTILQAAGRMTEIHAVIGGFHGFDQYHLLNGMELICPTHCTQHKTEIKNRYPDQYRKGGVGTVIHFDD